MCGIVAMIGDITVNHEKAFRTLLVLDSTRGEDSTGVVNVSKFTDQPRIAKAVGDPFQLFDTKQYERAMSGMSKCLIGHNRYATTGAVNRNNAHPFEHDTIIGVHNGTIRNKHNLLEHNRFNVDSDNLYYHIEKKGIADMLAHADGAWALVWWNKDEQSFNILRNKERPLYFSESVDKDGKADHKTMFFASEAWMLEVALSRGDIPHSDPVMVTVDTHFKIPVGKDGKLEKPTVKEAPGTYSPPVFQGYKGGTYHGGNVVTLPQNKAQEGKAVDAPKKSRPSVTAFDRNYLVKRSVIFEVIGRQKDASGNEYLVLFDGFNPFHDIRMYARKGDEMADELVDCEIIADVKAFCEYTGTPGKGYYKVDQDGYKLVIDDDVISPEEESDAITEAQFDKKYKVCDWCSNPVSFKDKNRFTSSDQCFCPACAVQDDVLEMVTFIN